MDWTVVVSVLVALVLWPFAAVAVALPLIVIGRYIVARRLRRAAAAGRRWWPEACEAMCAGRRPLSTAESQR